MNSVERGHTGDCTDSLVRTEVRDRIGIVTMTRPNKLNALTGGSFQALLEAFSELALDPQCRVVVLCGEGTSFSTGLDLNSGLGGTVPGRVQNGYSQMRVAVSVIIKLREMPQPVIAAVQGHAVGAGFALAAASDMRVASSDAKFNAVFTKIGMTPGDLGLSWFLPRLIGPSAAAEIFYTAGVIGGDLARELGLVNAIAEDPLEEAMTLAETISTRSPMGVRQTKELLNASLGMSGFREHLELELRSQVLCSLTGDHLEAVTAFKERRAPVFLDQ
jgi:enoyl-CoA hydratase